MKKFLLSVVSVAVVGALLAVPAESMAQGGKATIKPHKFGLIDMAYIFKHYEKFESEREGLKSQMEAIAKDFQDRSKLFQAESVKLKELDQESEQFSQLEQKLTQMAIELKALESKTKRDLTRQEAQIYKKVYVEITDAVKLYAKHYKYTLVLRYNQEEVADAATPQDIIKSMNTQVVFHEPKDDITQAVLKYLNEKHTSTAKAGTGSATR